LRAEAETFERVAQRGFDMLEILDQVRVGLLAGAIPRERLLALLTMVRSRSVATADDPRLQSLIEEIELRASVELAKLGEFF
jgi:hypothetical protein